MPRSGPAVRSILLAGATAGALDILYACTAAVLRGRTAIGVLHAVASGLLGREAFQGGWLTAALGLVAHFTIATGAASVYWLAARRFHLLMRRPVICGAVFGILVYLFMNFVVLPLSAAPFRLKYPVSTLAEGFAVHVFLVGLPIALILRRHWGGGALRPLPDPSLRSG